MVYTDETVIGIASEHGATEYSMLILTTEGLGHPQLVVCVRTAHWVRELCAPGVSPRRTTGPTENTRDVRDNVRDIERRAACRKGSRAGPQRSQPLWRVACEQGSRRRQRRQVREEEAAGTAPTISFAKSDGGDCGIRIEL